MGDGDEKQCSKYQPILRLDFSESQSPQPLIIDYDCVADMTGGLGDRTMETNGESLASSLVHMPFGPLFCAHFNCQIWKRVTVDLGGIWDLFICMVEPSSGHVRRRFVVSWRRGRQR